MDWSRFQSYNEKESLVPVGQVGISAIKLYMFGFGFVGWTEQDILRWQLETL